jgi:hypothetical protein
MADKSDEKEKEKEKEKGDDSSTLVCSACGFTIAGNCDYYTAAFGKDGKQVAIGTIDQDGTIALSNNFHEECFMAIAALRLSQSISTSTSTSQGKKST